MPVWVDGFTLNDKTLLAEPDAGGVTGLVWKAAVTPDGFPVIDNVTAELKLFFEETDTVKLFEPPRGIL